MQLLEKLDQLQAQNDDGSSEKVLYHELNEDIKKLYEFKFLKELLASNLYQALSHQLNGLIYGYEYGCFVDEINASTKASFIRSILWPLDQGVNYDGVLESLRNRAIINRADIYFFPAVDMGMARSGNHNVVRDLAIELGYNYFFATSYVNLNVDNKPAEGAVSNRLGLEGNAIMTRYPMSNLRTIPLSLKHDAFRIFDRKLGQEKAIVADLLIDEKTTLTVVCANFSVYTSAFQRARKLKLILRKLSQNQQKHPILIAGDFKTSTYDCSSPSSRFFSVLNKMYRGFDYIVQEHHDFPEKYFEKALFKTAKEFGFRFKELNEMGVGNVHKTILSLAKSEGWFDRMLQKLLKSKAEKFTFKQDWFFASDSVKESHAHQSERPKVITHLFHNGKSVSSHDPVLLDFEIKSEEKNEA